MPPVLVDLARAICRDHVRRFSLRIDEHANKIRSSQHLDPRLEDVSPRPNYVALLGILQDPFDHTFVETSSCYFESSVRGERIANDRYSHFEEGLDVWSRASVLQQSGPVDDERDRLGGRVDQRVDGEPLAVG